MILIARFEAMIVRSEANDFDRPTIICDHYFSGKTSAKLPENQMIARSSIIFGLK
jgi:hypothetical protein